MRAFYTHKSTLREAFQWLGTTEGAPEWFMERLEDGMAAFDADGTLTVDPIHGTGLDEYYDDQRVFVHEGDYIMRLESCILAMSKSLFEKWYVLVDNPEGGDANARTA